MLKVSLFGTLQKTKTYLDAMFRKFYLHMRANASIELIKLHQKI